MNTQQIEVVQRTFAMAAPMAQELTDTFYARLFDLDPSLRTMFAGDMKRQGEKLITVLAFVVSGLSKPDTILEPVKRLGERHVNYGVESGHYTTVGSALLWTLQELFGPAYTPEVADAWTAAYTLLAGIMMEAAADQRV